LGKKNTTLIGAAFVKYYLCKVASS